MELNFRKSELIAENLVIVRDGDTLSVIPRYFKDAPPSIVRHSAHLILEISTGKVLKSRHTALNR